MSALADVVIDRAAVSQALLELGVDLSHGLAAATVLGASDVLIALELADRNPFDADFHLVLNQLHSFRPGTATPPVVADAMRVVLERATQGEGAAALNQSSLEALRRRVTGLGL